MGIVDALREKAKQTKKHIVLPEGTEQRTVAAAAEITAQGIAKVTLLGDPAKIVEEARGANLSGVDMVNPEKSDRFEQYVNQFYELRKHKGVTLESARECVKDEMYYGVMMLKNGEVDGMVSGAVHTTGDVLKPGLQIIKTKPGIPIVSSCFLMEMPDDRYGNYGDNGILFFADCAVNINPDDKQLAAIARATAQTAQSLVGMEARIAMLSFSTKGSAKDPLVDKVASAVAALKQQAPELMVDGELQADAALVEAVGALKSPGSPVAGKANILVFPDLQAGNIGYKLVQRLAGATAIGPICQGMAKPINDLSRGCSVQDIVDVVAITSLQAQN
ncbi:MAG: phosphate acetyltransferase [Christensenellales bacterium]